MRRNWILVPTALLVAAGCIMAQKVAFESPAAWYSYRHDSIVVKAQIDTASVKSRQLALTLYKIENGKRQKIATKSVPVNQYAVETSFSKVGSSMLGGSGFLSLSWAITQQKEDTGSVAPFGIADSLTIFSPESMEVKKSQQAPTLDNVEAEVAANGGWRTVGGQSAAVLWSSTGLHFVGKKGAAGGRVTLVIDGKNAKSAFLSFPDRHISFLSDKDTILTDCFERALQKDVITYTSKPWVGNFTFDKNGSFFMITVPWYDLGILADQDKEKGQFVKGRKAGIALFSYDAAGKVSGAWPSKALPLVPGSWGDILFIR